ncbi:glucokinase, partial [Arthrobacter sp. Hiyo6]
MHTPSPGSQPRPFRRTAPWRSRKPAAAHDALAGSQTFRDHLRLGRKGLAIGVDIGGTKVAAGVVDAEGRILSQAKRSTPGNDPRAVEQVIVELVDELSEGHRIWSVGIGAAGWMDLEGGTVLFSPHLAWRNEPLRDNLQRLLRRPVLLTNDADAAAWAEWRFGAGQG